MSDTIKKICIIDPHYYTKHVGGAEVQLYLLACELIRKGWEVHYITGDVKKNETDQEIILHHFDQKTHSYNEFKNLIDNIKTNFLIQRGRKFITSYAGKYAKDTGKIFIWFSSMDIDCKKYKVLTRLLNKKKNIIKFHKVINAFIEDYNTFHGIKKASNIFVQSKNQQKLLKENLKLESEIFKNIHHIPELEDIKKDDPPLILWLATIKKWKQPLIFLNLVEKLKDEKCNFLIAGRLADMSFQNHIKSVVNRVENLTYMEKVSFQESNSLISRASIFVNTSKAEEGFPNTYIQSWLHKTPTVTLNFDPDDIITNHGFGYKSGSESQLILDVKKLIYDRSLRNYMGQRAREFAIKNYNVNSNVDELESILVG